MKLGLFFLLLAYPVAGTVIKFANRCMYPVDIFRTTTEGPQVRHDYLNPGEKGVDKFLTGAIGFKNGAKGLMQAEFEINEGGKDYFNLNAMEGFDIGMSITAAGNGMHIACKKAGCTDGFTDDVEEAKKERHVPTGGLLILTFCP